MSERQRAATTVASRTHRRGPDHPSVAEARRDLAVATIEQAVAKALAKAPPLTPAQIDRIAAVLRGAAARKATTGGEAA